MELFNMLVGWLSGLFAKKAAVPEPAVASPDLDWMVIAKKEIGQKEVPGPGDNPNILRYFSAVDDLDQSDIRDATPWCSAFVNWVCMQAGLKRTHDAMARSWLSYGIKLDGPKYGCIVVFARGLDGISGHVGFVVGISPGQIEVLSGNQSDSVCIESFTTIRVLGYRWPVQI